jgi:hypothetical protein
VVSTGAASSRITTVTRVRTSRRWIAASGAARTRGVRIAFYATRGGTAIFLVDQLAPSCRFVGAFTARVHRGRNVVRFNGRVDGRRLAPGTYRLTAFSRGVEPRRLAGVTVAVLARPAGRAVVRAALARNTCPEGSLPSRAQFIGFTSGGGSGDSSDGSGGGAGAGAASSDGYVAGVQAGARDRGHADDDSGGRLGAVTAPVAGAVEAIDEAARSVPPVLIALAALAVLLLAVASLPQPMKTSRTGAALVHHRATLALAGVGVLLGTVISFVVL